MSDLKSLAGEPGRLWTLDVTRDVWRPARGNDVYPGAVLLGAGPRGSVSQPAPETGDAGRAAGPAGRGTPHCAGRAGLAGHLADTEQAVADVASELAFDGLSDPWLRAACRAGLHHGLGTAHAAYTDPTGHGSAAEEQGAGRRGAGSAKGGDRRPYFRYELATALALLHTDGPLPDCDQRDLTVYLAAAHTGRLRMSVQPMPGEAERHTGRVLGVQPGDTLGPLTLPHGRNLPPLDLDPDGLFLGGGRDGTPSWVARTAKLLDELGPFRLAALEALIQIAHDRALDPRTTPPVPSV